MAFFHLSSVHCGIDGALPELLTSTSQHLLIDVNRLLMHRIIMCSCVPLELVHLAFQIWGYNRCGTGLFPSSKWARCPRPVSNLDIRGPGSAVAIASAHNPSLVGPCWWYLLVHESAPREGSAQRLAATRCLMLRRRVHGGRWWWPSLFHVDKFNSPTNPGL